PRSSSADARSRSAAAACGSYARHRACAPAPRSGRVAACSWLPEERMDGAVLGIEHLLTLIDLQGEPDIARGEQRLEVCFGGGQHRLAGALLDGRGASAAHAQIEIHEGVVALSVRQREMRGRIREYPHPAGGEDLLPLLILHGEH